MGVPVRVQPGVTFWSRTLALVTVTAALAGCGGGGQSEVDEVSFSEEAIVPVATGCFIRNATRDEAATRPSPLDSAMVTINGVGAKVCYGSPRMNERVVMGDLVPFDELWRTGANEATAIHTDFAAEIAGVAVAPGSYSIYTLPTATGWTVHVNQSVERWGIPITDEVTTQDLGSAPVQTEMLEQPVENMGFRFERNSVDGADLLLEWEQTRVRIPVVRTDG